MATDQAGDTTFETTVLGGVVVRRAWYHPCSRCGRELTKATLAERVICPACGETWP